MQCPMHECELFEKNRMCTSACISCGVLCDAFPISELEGLMLYKRRGCTLVVGDLYITNLPVTISRTLLLQNLGSVKTIRGVFYFHNNDYITALNPFISLAEVRGISLKNNLVLVDARIPSLKNITGPVTVDVCDRLCPHRYPRVGPPPTNAGCTNITMQFSMSVVGTAQASDFPLIAATLGRLVDNLSGVVVCGLLLE